MSLNDQIDVAKKYTLVIEGTPVKDQSAQANFALDFAKRRATVQAPEPPKAMPPIMPIAN